MRIVYLVGWKSTDIISGCYIFEAILFFCTFYLSFHPKKFAIFHPFSNWECVLFLCVCICVHAFSKSVISSVTRCVCVSMFCVFVFCVSVCLCLRARIFISVIWEGLLRKKCCSFGFCPIYSPPPSPQNLIWIFYVCG